MWIVNRIFLGYTVNMANKETKPLNMNIDKALLERVDKFRFKQMFASRSQAIEFLLDVALKANPQRFASKGGV
jgi:metal-responsive CopG/Arc/MetJ family transcriptional regulator